MTEIRVGKLIDLIIGEFEVSDRIYHRREYMLESLDFKYGNYHIKNPNNDLSNHIYEERDIPLSGEEAVYGDFLLYDYCGHDGKELIKSFNSLKELEKEILSPWGITNMFTTYNIAFVKGNIKNYKVENKTLEWIN
ncbi:hypothetical protein ACI2JA_03700 [Alkalihalobacillus sp. NPDC078783]